MLDKHFSASANENTELELAQIQEAVQILQNFFITDHFVEYSIQLKTKIKHLMSILETTLAEINETLKQSALRLKIKICRETIDQVFTQLLVDIDAEDIKKILEGINSLIFNKAQITSKQKEEAITILLTIKYQEKIAENNIKIKKEIEENKEAIYILVSEFLNAGALDFDTISQKIIDYLSQNDNSQTNKVHLSLWRSYLAELEKCNNGIGSFEKVLNFQQLIADYLGDANLDQKPKSCTQSEVNHWFSNNMAEFSEDLNFDEIVKRKAEDWLNLVNANEEKAFKIIKTMLDRVSQVSVIKDTNPVVDLNYLALFLLYISNLPKPQEQKIKVLVIQKLGYKIHDLIAAHFALEKRLNKRPPGRENCIVFGIITSLVANTEFEKFIISCIKPILDLMTERSVTISKGAHLFLKSSYEIPKTETLNQFELKIMSSVPELADFSGVDLLKTKKSSFILVQSQPQNPPDKTYFVDRRGLTPLIMPLGFAPNCDTSTLARALFPSEDYRNITLLQQGQLDILTDQTSFYLRDLPALIKIRGKNEFYLHAALGSGRLEAHKLPSDNTALIDNLKSINSDKSFYNSQKIWISFQHHIPLYEAILAMGGEQYLMQEYQYLGNLNLLKEAFAKSIYQLFDLQKYPTEVQRIIHDFSIIHKNELVGYLLTRFISPTIKFYAKDNSELRFWCEEIISYGMQAITASVNKKTAYQKRITESVLDFIYSEALRSEVANLCNFASELDPRLLDFQLRFIKPLIQLAKDTGLFNKMSDIEQSLAFEYQMAQFPTMLNQLKNHMDVTKEIQEKKETVLERLEEDEFDFLILCYWFQVKFAREVKLDDLISNFDLKTIELIKKPYLAIRLSALEKLKQTKINPSEAQARLENIKNREEYFLYLNLPPDDQLKLFIQMTCKKIWDKKIMQPLGLLTSQVVDPHFERWEALKKDFEKFQSTVLINTNGFLSSNNKQTNRAVSSSDVQLIGGL